MSTEPTELVSRTTIKAICNLRHSAMADMQEAIAKIEEGHKQAEKALATAQRAYGLATFTMSDRAENGHYQRLFEHFNPEASAEIFRHYVDARVWMHLMELTGMSNMMDKTAKDDLYRDLCGDVPEVNEENAENMFSALMGDANLIFQRGLARAFSDLDRRFKSHDAFKLGSRMIITNALSEFGGWNYHDRKRDTLSDIERVFAVLDGAPPNPGALLRAIEVDRKDHWGAHQSVTETPYFKARCFLNGNIHLWFKRDDLVDKANLVLADYYGAVLPDAVPSDLSEADLRSKGGALAKNLSFYATPEKVVAQILKPLHLDSDARVLEPSAGEGGMVRLLLETGAQVDAVEVHHERVRALRAIKHPKLQVTCANFLQMGVRDDYTHVIMNPPFYGTHWMEHVVHAFEFLAAGGTLVAVLPISAELGETKKHRTFRKWAEQHKDGWGLFRDLPAESFAESGTMVNTVTLTLRKRW